MESNKEIIEFIKEQITDAQIELYLKEVIAESIKEYEKYRPVYLKNEWSYEDIGNVLAKIMIVKVDLPTSALGKKEFMRLNSLHKHIVNGWHLFKDKFPEVNQEIDIYYSDGSRKKTIFDVAVSYKAKVTPVFWRTCR